MKRKFSEKKMRTFSEKTENFSDNNYVVYQDGGSIGEQTNARVGHKAVKVIKTGLTEDEAKDMKKRWNKMLTPGERKYYRISYKYTTADKVKPIEGKSFSDIDNAEDFRKYAHNVMKQAHGDDYSEEVTNKVVDDLIKDNPNAEWGELIGRLTSGFGEKSMSDNDKYAVYADMDLKKVLFKGTKDQCEDYIDDHIVTLLKQYPDHVINKVETKSFDDVVDWYVVGIIVHSDGDEEVYSAIQPQETEPTKAEVMEFEPDASDIKYFKVFKNEDSADAYADGLAVQLRNKYTEPAYRGFSDNMKEVTFRTTNPDQLKAIVNAIGKCGNAGHSFEIVIDPDSTKEEGGNIRFGWDGDGSDRIEVSED
jgi:hypothetical protein